MAEHAGSSKSKDVSQHPPLITPSASPPSSRVSHVSRSRPPEGPPFAKRPRLVSTPSSLRSFSTPSSSATAVDPHNDFYEERRKSQKRLVDFWAQLEGRYSRPLDEDDIIDVVSESMVKDGGFLRGLRKQLDIGCFQAGSGAQDTGDASSEGGGPLTEPEEEVDEIDAFATPAPEANFSDEWEKAKNVPPVQVLDPADAQDLEAFMEAERRRKELYGDEEDFDVCDITLLAGPQVSPCQRSSRSSATPSQLFDDGALGNADEEPGDEKEEYPVYPITPKRIKPRRKSIAPFIDDASEDEFAAWTTSESTPARSTVRKARAQSKSRTQTASVPARDIIDLTGASSKSGTQSDLASHIPDEIPIELAHSSAVRMRSRAKSKPPARRTAAKSVSPRVSLALIQLHTPPQSTSPAHEHEHDTAAIHDAPPRCETSESIRSRRETFSFPSPPRPRRRLPRVVQDQSATTSDVLNSPILSTADDISFAHASASSPSKASRPAITKSIATSKIVPDAVITEKYTPITRSAARKLRPPAPGPPSHENEESPVAPPSTARFTRRDKGKGKAGVESPDVPDSPELTLAVAPTMRTRSKRSTSKPLLKETPVLSSSESPLAKPSRGRKRKRIVSTSSISEPEGHVGVSSSDAGHYGPSSPSEHRETLARIQFDSPSPPSRSHITGSLSRVRDEGYEDTGAREHPPNQRHILSIPAPDPLFYPRTHPTSSPLRDPCSLPHRQQSAALMQDPDMQLRIAEAVQHLSSLLTAVTGVPSGQGIPFSPFPIPPRSVPWPSTPSRARRSSRRTDPYDSDPLDAASSSSPYASSSRHAWPYGSDQYSEGTLPPSSPLPSSRTSSPEAPHTSYTKERSRSRGLRVSFHLDDNDRPLPPVPQQEVLSNDEITQGRHVTPSIRRRYGDSGLAVAMRQPVRSQSVGHHKPTRSSMMRDSFTGKGKGRGDAASDDEGEKDARFGGSSPSDSRHTRIERGRTPGPPSRRERSRSVHAANGSIRGSSGMD